MGSEPCCYHPFAIRFALCNVIWVDRDQTMDFSFDSFDNPIPSECFVKRSLDCCTATGIDMRLLRVSGLIVSPFFGELMITVAFKVTDMTGPAPLTCRARGRG